MVNQQVLGGKWHEVSGKLKAKWGNLTDDDLRAFSGDVEQLVGRIQRKTGETRDTIERYLNHLTDEGVDLTAGVRDKVRETAQQAVDSAREGLDSLRQNYAEGYAQAERVVKRNPGQSVAVAFGLGLIAGLGAALLLHARHSEPEPAARGWRTARRVRRQVQDALADILPESLGEKLRG